MVEVAGDLLGPAASGNVLGAMQRCASLLRPRGSTGPLPPAGPRAARTSPTAHRRRTPRRPGARRASRRDGIHSAQPGSARAPPPGAARRARSHTSRGGAAPRRRGDRHRRLAPALAAWAEAAAEYRSTSTALADTSRHDRHACPSSKSACGRVGWLSASHLESSRPHEPEARVALGEALERPGGCGAALLTPVADRTVIAIGRLAMAMRQLPRSRSSSTRLHADGRGRKPTAHSAVGAA